MEITHERTLQTMRWASLIISLIAVGVALAGCKSPTAPDEPSHPNEILITEHTQCYADHFHLGKITVSFFEKARWADCSDWLGNDENGDPMECMVAGGAYPFSRHAEYYGPWVRHELEGPPPELEWTAAHEVCHMTGTWSEDAAIKCAAIAWDQAQCH